MLPFVAVETFRCAECGTLPALECKFDRGVYLVLCKGCIKELRRLLNIIGEETNATETKID